MYFVENVDCHIYKDCYSKKEKIYRVVRKVRATRCQSHMGKIVSVSLNRDRYRVGIYQFSFG